LPCEGSGRRARRLLDGAKQGTFQSKAGSLRGKKAKTAVIEDDNACRNFANLNNVG
jgi:hypothetical protein